MSHGHISSLFFFKKMVVFGEYFREGYIFTKLYAKFRENLTLAIG